jgi:hypothetical protein
VSAAVTATASSRPLERPFALTIGRSALLLVVFVPLCAPRFHRMGR